MSQATYAGQQDQNKCSIVENGNVVPVYDIRNCGPRHRFGANGKLVHNSNWLNFKRGSDIRKAIMAPEGHLLAPVDASQIEFRVCMYLAGQDDVIEALRKGEDPYLPLASEFYGEKIYKPAKDDPRRLEMEQKRGASKQANLMCLGADTQVLTRNGIKPILEVGIEDQVWDGEEWVNHCGVVSRGERNVERIAGVNITPDHLVLCGIQNWLPASNLQNENILCRALEHGSANLPLQAMSWALKEVLNSSWCNAHAMRQSIRLWWKICELAARHVAVSVRRKLEAFILKNTIATQQFVPTMNIGDDYSGELPPFTTVANLIQNIMHMPITEDVASKFVSNGKTIEQNFLATSLHSQDGTTQNWKLIESKIKKGIAQEILGLPRDELTMEIGVNLENSNKKLPTYDISYAGPRHRFTILSNRGYLIVHNCIYGAAGEQFQKTARAGLYGPPIKMKRADADRFVDLFRRTHPNVCDRRIGYWQQAEQALHHLAHGTSRDWGPLTIKNHRLYLPPGQPLIYDTLEWHVPNRDEDVREFERNGYWRMRTRHGWKKMWGSKLVQNICEAVSRVIVSQAMNRITAKGFRVLNWPYDELLILLANDGKQEYNLAECIKEFEREVAWLPGLPLAAEGSLGQRYSK